MNSPASAGSPRVFLSLLVGVAPLEQAHRADCHQQPAQLRHPGGQTALSSSRRLSFDRLADLGPPPRKHRHRYHGVFAPNHTLRRAVTAIVIENVGKQREPASTARGPPTDWGELVQVHDDRDAIQATDRRSARDRHLQPLTGAGRELPKPRERRPGTWATQTRGKRHASGCGAFRETHSGRPGRSSRASRVAHQPEDRCRSVIDGAVLYPTKKTATG